MLRLQQYTKRDRRRNDCITLLLHLLHLGTNVTRVQPTLSSIFTAVTVECWVSSSILNRTGVGMIDYITMLLHLLHLGTNVTPAQPTLSSIFTAVTVECCVFSSILNGKGVGMIVCTTMLLHLLASRHKRNTQFNLPFLVSSLLLSNAGSSAAY
jgi:hypothetical protein